MFLHGSPRNQIRTHDLLIPLRRGGNGHPSPAAPRSKAATDGPMVIDVELLSNAWPLIDHLPY